MQGTKNLFGKQAANPRNTGKFLDSSLVNALQAAEMVQQGAPPAWPDTRNLFKC